VSEKFIFNKIFLNNFQISFTNSLKKSFRTDHLDVFNISITNILKTSFKISFKMSFISKISIRKVIKL